MIVLKGNSTTNSNVLQPVSSDAEVTLTELGHFGASLRASGVHLSSMFTVILSIDEVVTAFVRIQSVQDIQEVPAGDVLADQFLIRHGRGATG